MFNRGFVAFLITVQLMIIIVSIGGNLLVCCAVVINKQLRMSPTSLFIFSLAVADILTASIPMSFEVDLMLKKYLWTYGPAVCTMYTTMYLIAAPSSVLNLMAVSVDRYLALSRPLKYKHGRLMTTRKALIIIFIVWLYAILTALLPVMGWNYEDRATLLNQTCLFNIAVNYSIASSFVNFLFPLIVTCVLNVLIYRISSTHSRLHTKMKRFLDTCRGTSKVVPLGHETEQNCLKTKTFCSTMRVPSDLAKDVEHVNRIEQTIDELDETMGKNIVETNMKQLEDVSKQKEENNSLDESKINLLRIKQSETQVSDSKGKKHAINKRESQSCYRNAKHTYPFPIAGEISSCEFSSQQISGTQSAGFCSETISRRGMLKKRVSDGVINLKAAKTILLIVSCFTICWLPHTTLSLVGSFCMQCMRNVPPEVPLMLLLLAYTNSCCNPFIYAFQRRDFRQTFKRILKLGRK